MNDIPDYEIGLSGGVGIKPFALYPQVRYQDSKNLKSVYDKYIITKVLSRNVSTSRFTAIVSWANGGTGLTAQNRINTSSTVLPIVQLSPVSLLPPIIDYRSFSFGNLPEGQPFNAEILDSLDGNNIGVYNNSTRVTAGVTGLNFSGNFVNTTSSGDFVTIDLGEYSGPTGPTGPQGPAGP